MGDKYSSEYYQYLAFGNQNMSILVKCDLMYLFPTSMSVTNHLLLSTELYSHKFQIPHPKDFGVMGSDFLEK